MTDPAMATRHSKVVTDGSISLRGSFLSTLLASCPLNQSYLAVTCHLSLLQYHGPWGIGAIGVLFCLLVACDSRERARAWHAASPAVLSCLPVVAPFSALPPAVGSATWGCRAALAVTGRSMLRGFHESSPGRFCCLELESR